jgi:HSF-type DNA-binding
MENNHHFAAFAQQQLQQQQQQQQQQPQMLAQDQQPNCTNQSQSNDGGIEAGQQQQTQSSDLQQQSQQPPQQQQQQPQQQQQQQLGTNSVRPDQQFFGGMNMSNFANFTQGFQMMQQPGQLGVTNPFGNMPASLMGATPLQQQLSALSGLTGQIQNHDGSNPFQANGFQGLQPAGLQTLQQMGFQPSVQQNQLQQQQSFFPGGFNPHFIPAVQAPQQAQQPTQQQQQLTPSQGAMMATAPQVGLNLQQLQQLMTQQLFAQQPGMPAGFNLSSLTGMTPAGMQASAPVPATVGAAPTLLPQQLASLAGMFGAQQAAMQQPATQHVFSNGINGISVPPISSIALPGLPTNKQDGETDGGVKSPPEAEWAEPFAGKGKKEPPFPLKLHQILSNPEFSECICWNTHGRSWRILKPPVFEQVVIPLYFR